MRLVGWLLMGAVLAVGKCAVAETMPRVQEVQGLYRCPQCGKFHTREGQWRTESSSLPAGNRGQETTVAGAVSIESNRPLAAVVQRAAHGVANVLDLLNGQRARQGLSTLRYDPQLQAVAERRVRLMAASGQKDHPPGSFAPGRYEGVGWSSSYSPSGVSACYTNDPRMQYAGAAMARGHDGVYFAVVYR